MRVRVLGVIGVYSALVRLFTKCDARMYDPVMTSALLLNSNASVYGCVCRARWCGASAARRIR